jgi:hypothetical protein
MTPATLQHLPPKKKRLEPNDPTLLKQTFQTVLRGQARLQAPLPWANPQELANFLGPRPDKACVQRYDPKLPHSQFNTHWTGQPDSNQNKTQRKAQRKEQRQFLKKGRKATVKPSKQETNTSTAYQPKNSPEGLRQIDREQIQLLRRAIKPCKTKRPR